MSIHFTKEITIELNKEIDSKEKMKRFAVGEKKYYHLLLDIQSWSLRCRERDLATEQFEVGEEDLAQIELDGYLRDFSPSMTEIICGGETGMLCSNNERGGRGRLQENRGDLLYTGTLC